MEVDGKPTKKITSSAEQPITLADGLPNTIHVVRLVKATEAFVGTGQILGFEVTPGPDLLDVHPGKHRLEVIGDSISCGYGDEGKSEKEHFSVDTENAYMAYGAVAARTLNADYTCIAWSGRKMWPDNTVPSIYNLTLPQDPSSVWNFPAPHPDAIVINLATNDFGQKQPDEAGWTDAYAGFIGELRKHDPKARVYCAIGTMMSDQYPPNRRDVSVLRAYLKEIVRKRSAAGDTNVTIIDFGTQDAAHDGLGSDWHPNLTTHAKMAAQLAAQIKSDLKW